MNWKPQTEEEVLASELCAEGMQPFSVLEASVETSKSAKNAGKEMLKIKLNIHADDGFDYHVYDYIAPWFMAFKFRHFFFAVGLGADYEAGTVNVETLKGREGWADVAIKKDDKYGPKNIIKDYKPQEAKTKAEPAKPAAKPSVKPGEDDVPF